VFFTRSSATLVRPSLPGETAEVIALFGGSLLFLWFVFFVSVGVDAGWVPDSPGEAMASLELRFAFT
jgi:hypothetical protein